MRHKLLFFSDDARLNARLQAALGADCAIMTLDPRSEDSDTVAGRFDPDIVTVDADSHAGLRTTLERITALRLRFAGLPLIVVGDEMSAQLVLAAFRAGVNDFIDREAADAEIRNTIFASLRDRAAPAATGAALLHVLSPAECDRDFDLALNAASLIAAKGGRRVLLIDLSLPASPLRTALGVEMPFTAAAAIREMVRLDQAFLDSALARAPGSGLFLLPLSDDPDGLDGLPPVQDLLVLLPMVRGLFDVAVIHWGAFSRHAAPRARDDNAHYLLGCGQRFSAVRHARALFAQLGRNDPPVEPVLAIHQSDPGLPPAPREIVAAVGARASLTLRADIRALTRAHNTGVPLGLAGPSAYADALGAHLCAHGLLADATGSARPAARLLRRLARGRA